MTLICPICQKPNFNSASLVTDRFFIVLLDSELNFGMDTMVSCVFFVVIVCFYWLLYIYLGPLVAQMVKRLSIDVGDLGSIPGLGRFPGEGNGNPLQYSCLENPMDGGAWCRLLSMGSQRVGHD